MFPHMKQHNWLFNYRTLSGTQKSLEGVVRRSAYLTESETAFDLFQQYYQPVQQCYRHFWAAVKPFAFNQFELLQHDNSANI
jgi:acyl carrier protein phosphodiesterase